MVFVKNESVDNNICNKLADIKFSSFLELLKKCPRYYDPEKDRFTFGTKKREYSIYEAMDSKTPLDRLYKEVTIYCRTLRKHQYSKKITYDYGKDYTKGRLYSKNGIAGMIREFRGVLLSNKYIDLDMQNCHPQILLQLCKNNNIQSSYLSRYVNEREQFLEEFANKQKITRSEAKTLIISCINSDYTERKFKYKEATNLYKEILEIQKAFIKLDKYKEQREFVIKKENRNIGGRLLNTILFEIEGELLQKAFKTLETEYKIDVDILIFDGFLIHKRFLNNEVTIDFILEKLNQTTNDYSIIWCCKEQDVELYESILLLADSDKIIPDTGYSYIQEDSLKDISINIQQYNLDQKLVTCGDDTYFKSPCGWVNSDKLIRKHLINYLQTIDSYIIVKYPNNNFFYKPVNRLTDYNEIYQFLLINCPVDDNFINKVFDDSINKVYFNNGYFDGKKKKFFESKDMNTFIRINKNYDSSKKYKKEKEQLMQKVFNPIFTIDPERSDTKIRTELFENWLFRYARSLFGHIEDKLFYTLEGQRDCGKGVLHDLTINTFENYIATTNSENFMTRNADSTDEAKVNAFMFPFQFKRLAFAAEFKLKADVINQKKVLRKVDGNILKKLISGGDRIEARLNFKDASTFRVQCGLSFAVNDFPEIAPADDKRVSYIFKSRFIDPKTFKETKLKNISYYNKVDSVKTVFIKKEDVQMAFFQMLVEALSNPTQFPKELLEEQTCGDVEDVTSQFFNQFNFDTSHHLPLQEIVNHSKNNDIHFTKAKVKTLLQYKGLEIKRLKNGLVVKNIDFKNTDSGIDE